MISKRTICLTKRTFIDKTENECDLESELEVIFTFLLTDVIKENGDLLGKVYKKKLKI